MMPFWLHVMAIVALAIGFLTAVVIAVDELRNPQHMWIMNVVWPVAALFGTVVSLWAYFRYGRLSMMRHEQVLFAQAQHSAACNVTHKIEARLARWLLRSRDLSGSDTLLLTQEFLSQMLGVRRPAISVLASSFQRLG
jgi:CRP-like cAMP-binding protein